LKKTVITIVVTVIIVFMIINLGNSFFEHRIIYPGVAYAEGGNISGEQLLARAINGEARGEPYEGQVAVGAVILNRTRDSRFPKTIAGVIYQPGAFTAVSDGQINVPISADSTVAKAAKDALNGWDPTNGCIYYWNPTTATSSWIWSRPVIKVIGKHYFAK
jgi:N-acetylmuramoyl-L-alanine amidase